MWAQATILDFYVLACMEDLLVLGDQARTSEFFTELRTHVLIRETGKLTADTTVKFLGRTLRHTGDAISMSLEPDYVEDVLRDYSMVNCKPVTAPGTSTAKVLPDGDDCLDSAGHRLYRKAVRKLLWLSTTRSDILYSVKELSRGLSSPTKQHLLAVTHLLRYLSGTKDVCLTLRPQYKLSSTDCSIDLDTYVDSDWAGRAATR